MKTVFAAALILLLSFATVAGTTAVAAHGSSKIEELLSFFPEEMNSKTAEKAEEALLNLKQEFQKWEPCFSLICPHSDVMHTEEYLAQLDGAVQSKSAESYDTALAGMKEAAEHLRRAVLPRWSDLL